MRSAARDAGRDVGAGPEATQVAALCEMVRQLDGCLVLLGVAC